VHALVNNAAISPKAAGGGAAPARSIPTSRPGARFFRVILCADHEARGLIGRKLKREGAGGHVTSIAGSRVASVRRAAYATSKAALASLTREMGLGFGRGRRPRHFIAPGKFPKPRSCRPAPEDRRAGKSRCIGAGHPDEGRIILWCCATETSSYVNGAESTSDGGQHV